MRLTVSQPCEPPRREGFPALRDDIAFCAPSGTDGTVPAGKIPASAFTLSRARSMEGFLAAAGFFPVAGLCCEDIFAALVSRSLAEVLQGGNDEIQEEYLTTSI